MAAEDKPFASAGQDKVVIVRLQGGLANQMFQYAAGRALASRRGTELLFDPSVYETDGQRQYRLDSWNVQGRLAAPAEVTRVAGGRPRSLRKGLSRLWQLRLPPHRRSIYQEPGFSYDPRFWQVPQRVLLVGFFQTERYFEGVQEQIRQEFTLRQPPSQRFQSWAGQIASRPCAAVHIRRGDYIQDPYIANKHGHCDFDYYARAVQLLGERCATQLHFFLFSDDPGWVEREMDFPYPHSLVESAPDGLEAEDLLLMSRCQHLIIANSSFSWWAAWLGGYPSRIVIAPQRWFRDPGIDTRDLYPPSWIKI